MFNQQHNDDAYKAGVERWKARKDAKPAQEQPKAKGKGVFKVLVGISAVIILMSVFSGHKPAPQPIRQAKTDTEIQAEIAKKEELRKQSEERDKKINGYIIVKDELISRLKDPDSFKELDYTAAVNDDGNTLVIITYTATNGFGGRVKGNAIGLVDSQNKLVSFIAEK